MRPVPSSEAWSVTLADGRVITSDERQWDEITQRFLGTMGPLQRIPHGEALVLSTYCGNRTQTLRAPDRHAAFFRSIHARIGMDGTNQIFYHRAGFLHPAGGVTMETDPYGNVTVRSTLWTPDLDTSLE